MSRHFLYNCSQPVLDVKIAFCQVCVPYRVLQRLVLTKPLISCKNKILHNGLESLYISCGNSKSR
uniref:Uncharacterized protein n=1 Tax=Xiphophorus maculatus TaxID=8083 RepID=A0A3B5R7S4_XIPMA